MSHSSCCCVKKTELKSINQSINFLSIMNHPNQQKLEELIKVREGKRDTLSTLFDRVAALRREMQELESELIVLDDQIDALEESDLQSTALQNLVLQAKAEPIEEHRKPAAAAGAALPMALEEEDEVDGIHDFTQTQATQNHLEYLTDPSSGMTQTQQTQTQVHTQYAYDDDEEDTVMRDAFSNPKPRAKTPLGPLDLNAPPRDSFPSRKAPPVASKPSRTSNTTTLDAYLTTTTSTRNHHHHPNNRPSSSSSRRHSSSNTSSSSISGQNLAARLPLDSDSFPWSQQVNSLLRDTFRIQSFREHQKSIINATLQGDDVFVIMRTGGGKSLTYQLPSLIEGRFSQKAKVTFVISPLLSLIHDQEDQMNQFCRNSAVSFTSGIGNSEQAQRWARVRDPTAGVCLVYVTPEKVHQSNKFRSELEKLHSQGRLGRFVIDECHCACQWGHDFRPDYAKLGILKGHFPSVPILAVTATASDKVRADCMQILRMNARRYHFFRSSADRPNLTYQVRLKDDTKDNVIEDMVKYIKENHNDSSGIVYAYSKKEADQIADQFVERGIIAASYHSKVSPTEKESIHRGWMQNHIQVVVATIAFGLGINKPDVRFVLHHTLSKTLEAYYQESGRAGRNGEKADCVLYYSPKDVPKMLQMVHTDSARSEPLFWQMVEYAQAFGNDEVCRAFILSNLGEPNAPNPKEVLSRTNDDDAEFRDVKHHAMTCLQLLGVKSYGDKLTLSKLVTAWRAKDAEDCVKQNPPGKDLNASECEILIAQLLTDKCIDTNVVWNKYSSNTYLRFSRNSQQFLDSRQNDSYFVRFPKRVTKTRKPRQSAASNDADGWVGGTKKSSSKSTATKKRASSEGSKKTAAGKGTTAKAKRNGKAKKAGNASKATRRKSTSVLMDRIPAMPRQRNSTGTFQLPRAEARSLSSNDEIIEIDDSDSDSDDDVLLSTSYRSTARASRPQTARRFSLDDSDSECEFEG